MSHEELWVKEPIVLEKQAENVLDPHSDRGEYLRKAEVDTDTSRPIPECRPTSPVNSNHNNVIDSDTSSSISDSHTFSPIKTKMACKTAQVRKQKFKCAVKSCQTTRKTLATHIRKDHDIKDADDNELFKLNYHKCECGGMVSYGRSKCEACDKVYPKNR